MIPIHWGSLVPFGLHLRTWSYLRRPPLEFTDSMRKELPDIQVQRPATWRVVHVLTDRYAGPKGPSEQGTEQEGQRVADARQTCRRRGRAGRRHVRIEKLRFEG